MADMALLQAAAARLVVQRPMMAGLRVAMLAEAT